MTRLLGISKPLSVMTFCKASLESDCLPALQSGFAMPMTPQAIRGPESPAGWLFRSSSFS
jgi:hypothetical protein